VVPTAFSAPSVQLFLVTFIPYFSQAVTPYPEKRGAIAEPGA
jgi:hypothetical protein